MSDDISRREVDAARAELVRPSHVDVMKRIEYQTSRSWAARALAAYELATERLCVRWLIVAEGFAHEALEHAANVSPPWVVHVDRTLEPARDAALAAVEGHPSPGPNG